MSILKSPIQPNGLKEVCLGSTLGDFMESICASHTGGD